MQVTTLEVARNSATLDALYQAARIEMQFGRTVSDSKEDVDEATKLGQVNAQSSKHSNHIAIT